MERDETLQGYLRDYGITRQEDVGRIERLAEALPLVAALTENDIFLDCVDPVQKLGTVAAQVQPPGSSLYQGSVVGQPVLPAMEPAVFHAVEQKCLVRDLKGVTQEGRLVRQDVLPLLDREGGVLAVLIREKDVSGAISQVRKYQKLANDQEACFPESYGSRSALSSQLLAREIHHRVKNNLQLVASLLNIQARQLSDPAIRKILTENTKRILNIAAIHDMLTTTEQFDRVHLRPLLERIAGEIQTLVPEGSAIRLRVAGDDAAVSSDRATTIALVVNELLLNSLEHGYADRNEGTITVSVYRGALYATVTVADDGCGFTQPQPRSRDGLGMSLVRSMVHEKLGGSLRLQSIPGQGTSSSFDVSLLEDGSIQ